MEGGKVLKGAFFALMCAILMSTLYMFFFGTGNWEGALFYASRQIEHPISKYYYTYCYLPNVHMEDGIDKALGGTCTALMQTKSDLELDTNDSSTFGTDFSHYSSGWY